MANSQNQLLKSGYYPALDGLRAVSILLVIEHHAPWHIAHPNLLPGGYIGVDVFFVLSGFLITTLLMQEWYQSNAISLGNFYVRRVLRLFPALLLLLSVTATYAVFFARGSSKFTLYLRGILPALFYSTNWVLAFNPEAQIGLLAITWSLAIEEQFYILWPPILVIALKFGIKPKRIAVALAIVVVLISLLRVWMTFSGVSITRMYYGTDTRADSLLIGCLLSLILMKNAIPRALRNERTIKVLAVLSIVALAIFALTLKHTGKFLYLAGFSIISISVAFILLMIFRSPIQPLMTVLTYRPVVWIGRISYGLYLWHWPVRSFVLRLIPNGVISEVAYLGLSFLIATLSFYFLERRFLRLKKHFAAAARRPTILASAAET